jgi:O-antigen/teichoic acid export membrane protein
MANQTHRNIVSSYANQLAGVIGVLILVPLYTRFLGHRLYGEWIVITSVATYLALANIGIDQTLTNRIAQAVAGDRKSEVRTLISTAFVAYVVIAAVLVVIFAFASPWLSSVLIPGADFRASRSLFLVTALSALALPWSAYLAALRGFERVDQEQAITACAILARNAALAAAVLLRLGLEPLALIQGGGAVFRGLAGYWRSRLLLAEQSSRGSAFSVEVVQSLIRPGLGFFALQIAGVVGFGIDNLVIGYALGPEAVTRYAVPYSMVMLGAILFTTAITAVMPTITQNLARTSRESQANSLIFGMRLAVLYGATWVVALSIAGPWMLRLWVGYGVFPGIATFRLQLTLLLIQVSIAPAYAVLVASTQHYGTAVLHVFESALNLVLSLWWVHRWGLSGVIAGTVVARLLTTAWYIPLAALEALEIRAKVAVRRLWPTVTLALGSSAAAIAFGLYAKSVIPMPAPVTAGLAVMAFAVTYAGIALDQEDRRKLLARLADLRFRIEGT